MNIPITTEMEDFYHIKYGFSLRAIHALWDMSKDANELERNLKAAESLNKTFMEMRSC